VTRVGGGSATVGEGSPELRAIDSLQAARPLWEELEAASGNPFATYAFADTWWRHLGERRPLRLSALVDSSGSAVALLPLFVAEDGDVPTLRLIGHVEGDLLGPICAPEMRPRATRALADALGPRPVRLIANDVAEGTAALLGATVTATMASPVTKLPAGGWPAVLADLSANHRAWVRAKERRLARMGRVEVREADSATLERDFTTLVRLHNQRWGEQSVVYRGPRLEFHADFAEVALRRGWLRLRVLELDGVAVAANYALRYAGDEWFWQSGRDSAYDPASVGAVLTAHCIRASAEDGLRVYRWLRGDEAYKLRWATGDEPVERAVLERP
jgi:CelD/BcsL family acetyltransferase involved in cellulose biosynthesis